MISLTKAAKAWARITGGPTPHRSTLLRWIRKGVGGIRLPALRAGGRFYVREMDVEAFFRRLNTDCVSSPTDVDGDVADLDAVLGEGR